MSLRRLALGKKGEEVAANYLKKQGYRILKTNYRCRMGELDIIARKKDTIVFVEVRSRSSKRFGLPQESIGPAKQRKIRAVASYYLQSLSKPLPKVRFDVLALYFSPNGQFLSLEHFKNAF